MKTAMRFVRAAALCVLLCVLLAGCGASDASASPLSQLSFSLDANGTRETISCYAADGGEYIVFLPSCAQMDALTVRVPEALDASLDGIKISDGMTCGALRTDTDYALTVGGETAQLRFLRAQNTPALFVHTQSGDMAFVHAHKTEKEQASLRLLAADGSVAYQSAGTDFIRGRGNSTWSKEKKPYNLYLHAPADLLGMGEANEWALLANAFDETNLRNNLICDFAKRVSGDPKFAPDTELADVYLNGEYAGLYLLSEKPQIGENRLDVSPDATLFSWVQTKRSDAFFPLSSTLSVQIESPDPCTDAQKRALQTDLLAFQDALISGDGWQDYIDAESFAHKYLIEEVFLNYDVSNSQYFYCEPGEKLFAGPCWDYDLTLGISWRNTWSTPECFSAQNRQDDNETWYSLLWKQDAFRSRVKTLFSAEYLPLLEALADGGIAQKASEISASSEMNALRWPGLFGQKTSAQAVDEMTAFLSRRIAFLRAAWIDETPYCTLTLCHPVRYEYICVTPGTVCADFPQPQALDLPAGTLWLREDTGEPFDPQSVITKDLTLTLPPQPKALSRQALAVIGSLAAMAGLIGLAVILERRRRHKQ